MPPYDPNALNSLWETHFWAMMLTMLGNVLWIIAYVGIVAKCFKQKTYGVPIASAALNIAWEALFSTIFKSPVFLWWISAVGWLIIDIIIVYQIFRYGRSDQRVPELRKHYYLILIGIFGSCLGLMYTFVIYFNDTLGFTSAFVINFVMSTLFVTFLWRRPKLHGLSLTAAICKGVGTGVVSIGCYFLLPAIYPTVESWSFIRLLNVLTFLLDTLYAIDLGLRMRRLKRGESLETVATSG